MTHNPQEDDLPKLSAPARRALATIGVYRLEQVTAFSEAEIKELPSAGCPSQSKRDCWFSCTRSLVKIRIPCNQIPTSA
jgi:predicted flap endonuclease-1-like 5' DNA nuclease